MLSTSRSSVSDDLDVLAAGLGDNQTAPRSRRLAPIVVGVVALVVASLFWLLLAADTSVNETAETPLLGQPAPGSTGLYADGTPFELSRRKGSWVVLNFFTSDCVPCQREHPELVKFVDQQRSLGNEGAEFYSIVQNDSEQNVEAFFAERGGDWPIIYDDRYQFQNDFGVAQVPETWIIDPDGFVRGRIISEVTAEFLSTNIQTLREPTQ